MNVALQRAWTQQDFFAWAEAQEERYEFDGVRPIAITGGTFDHGAIGGNIYFALASRLREGPGRPMNSDAGIQTVGDSVRYPDAEDQILPLPEIGIEIPVAEICSRIELSPER